MGRYLTDGGPWRVSGMTVVFSVDAKLAGATASDVTTKHRIRVGKEIFQWSRLATLCMKADVPLPKAKTGRSLQDQVRMARLFGCGKLRAVVAPSREPVLGPYL